MGECERGECNTPSACRAHNECLARDRKDTVGDSTVIGGGLNSETVADVLAEARVYCHKAGMAWPDVVRFCDRIEAAHAHEIESLRSDLGDYMQAANTEAARGDSLAAEIESLRQRAEAAEARLIDAYDAGFMASDECWNGEHGPDTENRFYVEKRTRELAAIATQATNT